MRVARGELRRVLRGKFRVPTIPVDELEALLRQEGELVRASDPMAIKVRNEPGVNVVSDAVSGKADVLVSGDRDLLAVNEKLPLKILTPRGFWERVRDQLQP